MHAMRALALSRIIALAVTLTLASAESHAHSINLVVPEGLNVCPDNDPVIAAEKRVAPSVGSEYLACFVSPEKTPVRSKSKTIIVAAEHAIVMSVSGGPYNQDDLEFLLSAAHDAWKKADPLSQQHATYVAQLNGLLKGSGASIESDKPVLVSFRRLDDRSYAVISLRRLALSVDGEQVKSVKADATAMVLQGDRLIRLTILHEVSSPSDVDEVRTQIDAWAHAVAADATYPGIGSGVPHGIRY